MEHRPSDADSAAWFLAGFMEAVQAQDADVPELQDGISPDVIIAVSLDELDGMTGDLLV
ncbi:MAG TPA: hypothetical protein VEV63_12805 [Streptosporangiaceae bacterium]|nr:hypothetical protein [Streptosporangiaceae bacterium]